MAKKHPAILLVMVGLVLGVCGHVSASGIKVIANSDVPATTISPRELKGVFLSEKTSLSGTHVTPVFEKGGPVHAAFLKQYLDRSSEELQRYYLGLEFSGQGSMPKTVSSDEEAVDYVSRTRGAIGYVSADANAEGVKTLTIADGTTNGERKLLLRVDPVYPAELQRRGIGGTVRLQVIIAANGTVENAELLGGNPVLADAAIAAVTKWKYSTAASRTITEVSVPFEPHP